MIWGTFSLYFPGFWGQCHFCIPDSPMFSCISGFQGQNGVQKGQESGVSEPENTIKLGIFENTIKQREFQGISSLTSCLDLQKCLYNWGKMEERF